MKFLFYFAVTGWFLGLTIHLLTITGIDVLDKLPFVWILHVGIFVVWLPAVLKLRNRPDLPIFQKSGFIDRSNPLKFFKIIFKDTPTWLTVIAICGFYYAIINFLFFFNTHNGTAIIENGKYILESHGTFIKVLTEQEYHHYRAEELRGFSGHWIAFYGVAMSILYPYKKIEN